MEERIKKFMEYKGISSSELADAIGVQRSNVTHVLKGRNKPSFQFIEKMLQVYPELNAKWLLLGTGAMVDTPMKSRSLFDQNQEATIPVLPKMDNPVPSKIEKAMESPVIKEQIPNAAPEKVITPVSEQINSNPDLQNQVFSAEKPIERLIVFFNDSTFKVYNPSR